MNKNQCLRCSICFCNWNIWQHKSLHLYTNLNRGKRRQECWCITRIIGKNNYIHKQLPQQIHKGSLSLSPWNTHAYTLLSALKITISHTANAFYMSKGSFQHLSLKRQTKNCFIKKLNYRRIAGSCPYECVLMTSMGTEQTPLNSVSHWRQFTLVTGVSPDLHQRVRKRNSLWQFWTCHILISVFLSYHAGRAEASSSSASVSGVSRRAKPFGGRETKAQAHQLLAQSHSWDSCRRWNKPRPPPDSEADTSAAASPRACDQGSAFVMSNQLLKNTSRFPPAACCNLPGERPAPGAPVPAAGSPPAPRPPPWPSPSPPCLRSRCAPLPLASTPAVPTPVLLEVMLQSLPPLPPPRPGPGRPLPSSWPLSSLPGIGLPEADIKNPLLAIRGFVHAESHTHLQIPVWHGNALRFGFSDEHFKVFLRTWVVRH